MSSANLNAKIQQLNAQMEGEATIAIDNLEKRLLRPKAKQSYQCVVQCYDKAGSTGSAESLQMCSQQCQVAFQQSQAVVQQEVSQFQNRLNRAMMQCQDEARDIVTGDIQSDARQMRKFESKLLGCMNQTVHQYIGLLPSMVQRVERSLK